MSPTSSSAGPAGTGLSVKEGEGWRRVRRYMGQAGNTSTLGLHRHRSRARPPGHSVTAPTQPPLHLHYHHPSPGETVSTRM